MNTQNQIKDYITSLPEPKQKDLQDLHDFIINLSPEAKLWFLDGRDSENKVISNPNIGYGEQTMKYADGKTREFYRVGISANKSGISVYVLGIDDKSFLAKTYGDRIGKASVTGYCIKFKALKDVDLEVLKEVILFGLENGEIKLR